MAETGHALRVQCEVSAPVKVKHDIRSRSAFALRQLE
jgi:hypothetical protein